MTQPPNPSRPAMTEAEREAMVALAEKVAAARGFDNALDCACELALFTADAPEKAIRLNGAGTKVIVTFDDGSERTFAARDYTISAAARKWTVDQLRARANQGTPA